MVRPQVFNYRKLPFSKGAINANCSVEIDGKHYVFGNDDIWTHDGYSEQSSATARRATSSSTASTPRRRSLLLRINQKLKQIHFCYVSGDGYVNFLNSPDGCNRALCSTTATARGRSMTLPMVFAADSVNLSVTQTYATVNGNSTPPSAARIWIRKTASSARSPMSAARSTSPTASQSLYAFDLFGAGSTVVFGVDPTPRLRCDAGEDGIDLDDLGKDLRGYVTSVRSTRRRGRTRTPQPDDNRTDGLERLLRSPAPIYDQSQTYDGDRCTSSTTASGRFLAIKMTYPDYHPFTLTGSTSS
jgi:hypothetical protein